MTPCYSNLINQEINPQAVFEIYIFEITATSYSGKAVHMFSRSNFRLKGFGCMFSRKSPIWLLPNGTICVYPEK